MGLDCSNANVCLNQLAWLISSSQNKTDLLCYFFFNFFDKLYSNLKNLKFYMINKFFCFFFDYCFMLCLVLTKRYCGNCTTSTCFSPRM
jgi:hypothetical protein